MPKGPYLPADKSCMELLHLAPCHPVQIKSNESFIDQPPDGIFHFLEPDLHIILATATKIWLGTLSLHLSVVANRPFSLFLNIVFGINNNW